MQVVPNPRHWLRCQIHDLPCPFWQYMDALIYDCTNPRNCESDDDFADYLRTWVKSPPEKRRLWGEENS